MYVILAGVLGNMHYLPNAIIVAVAWCVLDGFDVASRVSPADVSVALLARSGTRIIAPEDVGSLHLK